MLKISKSDWGSCLAEWNIIADGKYKQTLEGRNIPTIYMIYMYIYIGLCLCVQIYNNVWTRVANCLCAHESVIYLFAKHGENKHQNGPRVSPQTVHLTTYIIWFLNCNESAQILNAVCKYPSHRLDAGLAIFASEGDSSWWFTLNRLKYSSMIFVFRKIVLV